MKTLSISEPKPAHSIEAVLVSGPLLVPVLLISIVGMAFSFPLFDLDEGAFSEATRELLASGNWVSTYLNGVPRYDKPILIYWLQALSVSLFGISPLGFRLPSMLAAVAWAWVLYRFGREHFGEVSARLAVLILSCSVISSLVFKAAIADALLNLLLTLSFFGIYRYCQQPHPWRLPILGVIMGLGFLTKGPVAIVLPLCAAFVALAICERIGLWWRAVSHPYSWLSCLVVIAPWHIAVYLDQGWDFFTGFYLGHNLGRFGSTMEGHGGSLLYYFITVPLLVAPFTGPFLRLLAGALRSLRASVILPGFRKKPAIVIADDEQLLRTYLWVWFISTFLVFSFSQTQLPHYILYGMPPIFLLLAAAMAGGNSDSGDAALEKAILTKLDLIIALVLTCITVLLPFALQFAANSDSPQHYDDAVIRLARARFVDHYQWISLLLMAVLIVVTLLPVFSRLSKLVLYAVTMMVSVNFVLLPVIASAQQQPVREAALLAKSTTASVVAYKINMPSFSVYAERIVPRRDPEPGDWVFTRIDKLDALRALDASIDCKELFRQGGIVLVQYGAPLQANPFGALQ